MKVKRRVITSGSDVYVFEYDNSESASADEWYAKQLAKPGFIDPSHTVEDIDNPEYTKYQQLKQNWIAVRDDAKIPTPLKQLIKELLKDMIEDIQ